LQKQLKRSNKMSKVKMISGAVLALSVLTTSCNTSSKQNNSESKMEQKETMALPTTDKWVKSPIRNRLVVELDKSLSEVWALVGDPANMPKFSAGLDSVTTKTENGKCTQYTCYFKPMKEGEPGYVHTDNMLWQEENRGWASRTPEPNEMGYTDYMSLLTLEDVNGKTKLTWAMTGNHEKAEMIEMNKQGLVQAYDDIGKQLVEKFGGKIIENYVEK
jgi:carbon monoxide dehydrogenase subunit G